MANTQIKLRQIKQDSASSDSLIKWNGSEWAASTASNDSLASGVGGIYKGSGTIPASTVATVSSASDFYLRYSNADDAIVVDDLNSSVLIRGKGVNPAAISVVDVIEMTTSFGAKLELNSTFIRLNGNGGYVQIGGGSSASELRLVEPSGSGSNYTGFIAPALSTNLVYTLPTTATDGYFLKYNSSGNQLEWAAVSAGGNGIYGGSGSIASAAVATIADESTFTIDYFDGSNALHFVDNGETFNITSGAGYGVNANSTQVQMLGPNSDYVSVTSTGPIARGGLTITNGYLKLSSDISPTQITADQNDYSPTGLADAAIVRLSSDASRTITGIDASTKGGDGDILTLINVGSFDIILSDNDAASLAANRMALGGTDITLGPGFSITLIYDDTSNIWRTFSYAGGTGAADGNGIYSGSGTIPSITTASLEADGVFSIEYSDTSDAVIITDFGGTSGTIAFKSITSEAQLFITDNVITTNMLDGPDFRVTNNGTIDLAYTGGNVTIGGGTTASELRFLEPSASGTHYSALKAQAQASSITYTLPSSTATGVLHNDGSNVWSWSTVSNSDLASGVGGIYKGSGTIATGATATLPSAGTFTVAYNGGNPAIQVNDSDQSVVLYDKTQTNYVYPNQYGVDIYHAKDIILNPAPSTDHTAFGFKIYLTANENQAFGDVVYINTDGEAQLADADAIATAKVVGMCTETVTANNVGTYLIQGTARDDSWAWTVGGHIYLSTTGTTGNTLTQTAPSGTDDCVVVVGVATHTDRMLFNPSPVIVEIV